MHVGICQSKQLVKYYLPEAWQIRIGRRVLQLIVVGYVCRRTSYPAGSFYDFLWQNTEQE